MLVIDWQGVMHKEFVLWILQKWWTDFWKDFDARPDKAQSGNWYLLHDNALSHNATIIKLLLPKKSVTLLYTHSAYSPDLAPAAYFLFTKVKSSLNGCRFDTILDIQNNESSELKEYSSSRVLQRKSEDLRLCQLVYRVRRRDVCRRLRRNKVLFLRYQFFMNLVIKLSRRTAYYIFWACVCNLWYPACNVHLPYYT